MGTSATSLLAVFIQALTERVPARSADIYSLVFAQLQHTALNVLQHSCSAGGKVQLSPALAQALFELSVRAPTKHVFARDELSLRAAVFSRRLLSLAAAATTPTTAMGGMQAFLQAAKTPFDDQMEAVATGKGAGPAEPEKDIEMPLLLQHLQNVIGLGMCSDNEAKLALCAQGGDVNAAMNNILSGNLPRNRSDAQVNEEWNALLTRLNIREVVEAYER